MLEFVIQNLWRDVSHRSMLYYLFLLELSSSGTPEDQLTSNREELAGMASLQDSSFDNVIKEYFNFGIIMDQQTCRLSRAAIFPLEKAFDTTFGTHEPDHLRYNGLRIFKGTEAERIKLWVEKASQNIESIFCNISNIRFAIRDNLDVRKTKRLVVQEIGGDKPFVIWNLIGNARMTRATEMMDMISLESEMLKERAFRKKRGDDGYTDDGVDSIAIVAAPTYEESLAKALREGNKRIIGPINFEGLIYYLENRQLKVTGDNKTDPDEILRKNHEIREQQFIEIINALREHGGIAFSGIVDCLVLAEYLDIVLKDLYATHGVNMSKK